MVEAAEGEGADILGFQIALLADEELSRPAFDAIAAGLPPIKHGARHGCRDRRLSSAEDDYFRARTADLEDIRDRVLLALAATTMHRH